MSMWEPRSSHLYVGPWGGLRVVCGSCAVCASMGPGHTPLPSGPLGLGAEYVCVSVFTVPLCAPVCVRALVVLCVLWCWCLCSRVCCVNEQHTYVCVPIGRPCVGKGHLCLCQGVCVCVYRVVKDSWHSPALPRSTPAGTQSPCTAPFPTKTTVPQALCRLPIWDVLSDRLSLLRDCPRCV